MKKGRKEGVSIVLTGGHAGATAYALIQNLRTKRRFSGKLYWIGASKAIEGKSINTFGQNIFPRIGVTFKPILAGRIQRKFTFWTIPSLAKIPFGFLHAIFLLLQIHPNLVLSFGGYAAYPVVFAAWLLRIPIVLHEQTIVVGRANRYAGKFANIVALARENSKKYFPRGKSVVIGNPVSMQVLKIRPRMKKRKPSVILITGGSRGSVAINELVEANINELIKSYKVVHQAGEYQYLRFKSIKKRLRYKNSDRYDVYGFVKPWKMADLIKQADIVVSRSGANIVSELLIAKRPALLIPLPFSYMDEQRKNAEFAAKFGVAKVLDQEKLTPEKFLSEVRIIDRNWERIVEHILYKKSPDVEAADKLSKIVLEHLR